MNEPPNIEELRRIAEAQLPPLPPLPSAEEFMAAVDEQMRTALSPEEYAEWKRPLTPEEQAEVVDAIEAKLRRLMDEPQPTTTESKAGMTAAQARAELDAITRGPIPKE